MNHKLELQFQTCSNQSKNLLVCLHGNSVDSNYFSALLEGVAGWMVVAPDFIGHGESPKLDSEDYNYENFVQCLVQFIDQFSYDRLVIVGHSMGGNLAIELMNLLQIDGLLLMASLPVSYSSKLSPYLKMPDFKLSERHQENRILAEKYLSQLSTDQSSISYLTQAFLKTDPVFRDRLLEEFGAMKFSDQLELLQQNNTTYVGYLMGLEDAAINREYLNQLVKEEIFDFFDVIPNCGHYSFIEAPLENKKFVLKFIERV